MNEKDVPLVRVYRNLNNGKLSVRSKSSGKVIGWCDKIILEEVTLIVNEKGRDKVRKEKVKGVHAFIQGYPVYVENFKPKNGELLLKSNTYKQLDCFDVYYNPYTTDFWVDSIFKEVLQPKWDWCKISSDGKVIIGENR